MPFYRQNKATFIPDYAPLSLSLCQITALIWRTQSKKKKKKTHLLLLQQLNWTKCEYSYNTDFLFGTGRTVLSFNTTPQAHVIWDFINHKMFTVLLELWCHMWLKKRIFLKHVLKFQSNMLVKIEARLFDESIWGVHVDNSLNSGGFTFHYIPVFSFPLSSLSVLTADNFSSPSSAELLF